LQPLRKTSEVHRDFGRYFSTRCS